jgi:hypothetical protein
MRGRERRGGVEKSEGEREKERERVKERKIGARWRREGREEKNKFFLGLNENSRRRVRTF